GQTRCRLRESCRCPPPLTSSTFALIIDLRVGLMWPAQQGDNPLRGRHDPVLSMPVRTLGHAQLGKRPLKIGIAPPLGVAFELPRRGGSLLGSATQHLKEAARIRDRLFCVPCSFGGR